MEVYGWPMERRNENPGHSLYKPIPRCTERLVDGYGRGDKKRFDQDTRSRVDSTSAIEGCAMST